MNHTLDQPEKGAVRAVGTAACGLDAPEPSPGPAGGASHSASRPGRLPPGQALAPPPGSGLGQRPRAAGSPLMCQKLMFATARPTSLCCRPGQARPADQRRFPLQPQAPLHGPPRQAPPRHVRSCPGVRGHSVTHEGGCQSMRRSARACGVGLWEG